MLGALLSDNGDAASFETFSLLYQVTQLLESREIRLELKRGDCIRVQT